VQNVTTHSTQQQPVYWSSYCTSRIPDHRVIATNWARRQVKQKAFEKCWAHSLLRAVLHCHTPGVATAATVARRLRIDVHDDDDDDDNA